MSENKWSVKHCVGLVVICFMFCGFYHYHKESDCTLKNTFYFVRHGQTDGNLRGIMHGSTDSILNKQGIVQAHTVAQELKKYNDITMIVSSPLKRARVTAEIIGQALNKPIIFLEELREQCAGDMEGKPYGTWFLEWDQGKLHIPNAEPWKEFKQRIQRALCKIAKLDGPVLIVGHGRVAQAIVKILLPHDKNFDVRSIKNAVPFIFRPPTNNQQNWTISALN